MLTIKEKRRYRLQDMNTDDINESRKQRNQGNNAMKRKTLALSQAQAFHNAAMQAPYMSSKYLMYRRSQRRLMAMTTPPESIRAVIDAIATKRNVTLYKGK